MSQNTNTIYNNLSINDTTNNTSTTISNNDLNFGSNLLTTPLNTTYSNSAITTSAGNIGFDELFIIRDSVQAVALPIPNDGLTFKVVDTIEIANQENPIGATKIDYGYNSITSSNGLTVNGTTTFSSVPKTSILPSAPEDLVNLTYLQNNPPPSAVIFYFNNSQVPSPTINTYKLLAVVENELPQSTVNTSISGIGTTQLIQGFANQLINLNGSSFIPSGVWDCNFWASTVNASDDGHISIYFSVFGISNLNVETQIGVNSSSVLISGTSITQYKISLALSYTDISTYESLVVKLYAVNNRTGSTSIVNYFESGSSYSHIHTSFGVYVPPSILSLNNTFTGSNTFSQTITGSITGNSNTATTSNTTLSAPDSSLSSNVPLKNGVNVFTNNNTFNNLISGSISGNSNTSTSSASSTLTAGGSGTMSLILSNGTNGIYPLLTNIPTYTTLTATLNCNAFNGALTGNATTSTTSNTTLSAPDSALSSNVPLKDGVNVFTSASNTLYSNVVGSTPYLIFDNTGANLYISSARNGSPGNAPPSFTTGSFNHCIGSFCGNSITTGIENFIFGRNSLQYLTTGQRNCAFGNASLASLATDLSYNTAMGWRSAFSLQTGNINNVAIGQLSGGNGVSVNATNCTFLGSATRTNSTVNLFNKSSCLGADSVITASNQIVLGTATETVSVPGAITSVGDISTTGNFSGNSATFTSAVNSRIYQDVIQNVVNGQTISFGNGSLLVDTGATALTITLPVLNATSNGWNFDVQKTSTTNHNLDVNAGAGNQIASLVNVLGASYRLTNTIYQQSFRFINPNWYPY